MEAIVSIHDVMPATLDRVRNIIDEMPATCLENLVLLIVPGLDWRASEVEQLREWQDDGMVLAGHGWRHEVSSIKGAYHRLHSLIISRNAAEHLSLTPDEIADLIERNFCWFVDHGLDSPELYVPPAWAMGSISRDRLAASPYRYFEVTSGLIDAQTGRVNRLPLVGFEADNIVREFMLRLSNLGNEVLANVLPPLRISIHPYDLEYRIAGDLRNLLGKVESNLDYRGVFL